jgi:hypothetical protein
MLQSVFEDITAVSPGVIVVPATIANVSEPVTVVYVIVAVESSSKGQLGIVPLSSSFNTQKSLLQAPNEYVVPATRMVNARSNLFQQTSRFANKVA